jgi:PAS domain-containing protein
MEEFIPHGYCIRWSPAVVVPWIVGNGLIALAYATIPALLARLRRRRPDLIPGWAAWSFGLFILLCGIGHVLKIVTLWVPAYPVAAWLDVATGIVSWPAAGGLFMALWHVGKVISPSQVEKARSRLPVEDVHAFDEALERLSEIHGRYHTATLEASQAASDAAHAYRKSRVTSVDVEASGAILWRCDEHGKILYSRGGGLRTIGLESDEAVGSNINDWPQPFGYRAARRLFLEGDRGHLTVLQGPPFVCVTTYAPAVDPLGNLVGVIGVTVPTGDASKEAELPGYAPTTEQVDAALEELSQHGVIKRGGDNDAP